VLIYFEKIVQHAYVIHQYPYADTSAIVKLWTDQLGYVTAMAKGVKSRREHKTLLRPFLLLQIELSGKKELLNLTVLELTGQSEALAGKALYAGLYLNELLMRLLPEKEPIPELFIAYQRALSELATGNLEATLRTFEWTLFSTLGYLPTVSIDQHHDPIDPCAYYHLHPGSLPQRIISSPELITGAYLGAHLIGIEQQTWHDPLVLKAAKQLMRCWINHYVGQKPLKSRSFFS
jgi:DNA repair protein RecO (recombination protein O)